MIDNLLDDNDDVDDDVYDKSHSWGRCMGLPHCEDIHHLTLYSNRHMVPTHPPTHTVDR